jgi:hypothetical protein
MIASRADRACRRIAWLGGLAAALSLISLPLAAQPLLLKRDAPPVAAPAPAETLPEPSAAAAGSAASKDAIVVNSLDAVNADAVGLIGPAENGFETDFWAGTPWPVVASLMPRMPESSLSPSIRSLASRILLSRGIVPEGKPESASFIRLRVDRLIAMGDVANALALLRLIPEEGRNEKFAQTESELLFFDGNSADACGRVTANIGRYNGLYWRQAQAFCLALAGDHARAALIADLMREQEAAVPAAFFAIIERLGGLKNDDAALPPTPGGLMLSMAIEAGYALDDRLIKNGAPAAIRQIALSTKVDPELRLRAIERAQAVGALSGSEVVESYRRFPFNEAELRNPITTAEGNWSPRIRALLVRAAATQPVSLGKAEVLRRAWQLSKERGGFAETIRASLPVVAGMRPSAALPDFAGQAARILFAGGRITDAMEWYGIVAADSERAPEIKQAAESLWPIAVIADMSEAVSLDADRLRNFLKTLRREDPENAQRRALVYFSVLEAVGREVPADIWRDLLNGPMVSLEPGLNRAWQNALDDAVGNRRTGEAALLVVAGAASTGDSIFASNAAGYKAILSLRNIGLDEEARRLAVETALAAGF